MQNTTDFITLFLHITDNTLALYTTMPSIYLKSRQKILFVSKEVNNL